MLRDQHLLHETHYAFFWALDSLAMNYLELTRAGIPGYIESAILAVQELMKLLDFALPKYHHEKVVYLDKLAQLFIIQGLIGETI